MSKKIKVFSLPWHVAHQHRLLTALPEIQFDYLRQHTRKWDDRIRPLPENVKWVNYFDKNENYDLAILHVDQQCLLPKLGKSKLFEELFAQVNGKVPIIVINHGTPMYPEMFRQMAAIDKFSDTEDGAEQWAKSKMKDLLNGVSEMVVNSKEAAKMWGWGIPIIHGYDPDEWFSLRKEPRVATCISPAGIGEKYYGRKLFRATRDVLKSDHGIELIWLGDDIKFIDWDDYKTFLGKTLVYFNPTLGSPMPGTRTEAMLSGSCVVTTPYQDASDFIEDGVNGFICKENPHDAAAKIAHCIFNYKEAVEIGENGRQTAIKLFNKKRYREEWLQLISKVLNKKI